MVRQWRPAIGRRAWELPRGFGEDTPVTDALRELEEVAGLAGMDATVTARRDVDSGMLESQVAVVEVAVAECSEANADAAGDGEVAEARWWSPAEIAEAVRSGDLRDAFTLAAPGACNVRRQ